MNLLNTREERAFEAMDRLAPRAKTAERFAADAQAMLKPVIELIEKENRRIGLLDMERQVTMITSAIRASDGQSSECCVVGLMGVVRIARFRRPSYTTTRRCKVAVMPHGISLVDQRYPDDTVAVSFSEPNWQPRLKKIIEAALVV